MKCGPILKIYTEPPEVSALTDEDSGDDDVNGDLDRLTGRHLRAPVEIQQRNNLRINSHTIEQNTNSDADRIEPLRKEKQIKFTWISGDIHSKTEELKCALAILILSGYDVKPAKRYYWDSKPDIGNEMIKKSMRKNRFEQIMQFLHVADNNNRDINDKGWKIRLLMDKLKEKFLNQFVPEENMNHDESMVKYFGRHSCKQFIRGKPIHFGYKMWSLNTKGGYLINFDLYQGKNPRNSTSDEVLYGKSTAPLETMLREFPESKKGMPYKLYTDNLFTSATLLRDMRDSGVWGTGTMRDNRLPKKFHYLIKKVCRRNLEVNITLFWTEKLECSSLVGLIII
ncbi:hypothetical protein JTB14_008379 [Gonioctena quinquepunctata]|nr:hypothetical protein JTB14_008379 [Gonioctena quinquepunctata]